MLSHAEKIRIGEALSGPISHDSVTLGLVLKGAIVPQKGRYVVSEQVYRVIKERNDA